MKSIRDIGEDALIALLLQEVPTAEGMAGPGDDCAVLQRKNGPHQLLKTDAIVEGVHWLPQTEAHRVGWKAIARVVSDMAAMGGKAREFLITLAMPGSTSTQWATELYRGMGSCLEQHGGKIVGGETTSCPDGSPIVISVAACGEVTAEQLTLRSGAKLGDTLLVTGQLGGSISGKHLDFTPRVREADWLTSHFKPSAMMDLSDGLAKDLPRLASASKCGFRINHSALPFNEGCGTQQALGDGEDYELLFAINAELVAPLLEAWQQQFNELPLTLIGELCAVGEEIGRAHV